MQNIATLTDFSRDGIKFQNNIVTLFSGIGQIQRKEQLKHDKKMQRIECETMLKMQAMQNQHSMQMQMQMMASLGSVFDVGGGGSGGRRHVGDGGSGGSSDGVGGFVVGGADSIFNEGDSLVASIILDFNGGGGGGGGWRRRLAAAAAVAMAARQGGWRLRRGAGNYCGGGGRWCRIKYIFDLSIFVYPRTQKLSCLMAKSSAWILRFHVVAVIGLPCQKRHWSSIYKLHAKAGALVLRNKTPIEVFWQRGHTILSNGYFLLLTEIGERRKRKLCKTIKHFFNLFSVPYNILKFIDECSGSRSPGGLSLRAAKRWGNKWSAEGCTEIRRRTDTSIQ